MTAFNDLILQLNRSRVEVAALYKKGVVTVKQAAQQPGGARKAASADPPEGRDATKGDAGVAPVGSVSALPDDDRDTLDGVRGRRVAWRAMLVEAAKEFDDRTVVGVMAGGASMPAEFPADTAAGALLPGASLVIVGELREAKGAWTFHVTTWGQKRLLDAGDPMVQCRWPQPIE